MTRIKWLQRLLVCLCMVGLLLPSGFDASASESATVLAVHDVRMDQHGSLHVVVVNAQGHPMPATQVMLIPAGEDKSIRGTTNVQGRCEFRSLTGGSYSLQTSEGICRCRIWTSRAAPPKAAEQLLIVNDRSVQRGQRPIREMFHSDPILMTAIAVAAIAIPVAIHQSRDDSRPGS